MLKASCCEPTKADEQIACSDSYNDMIHRRRSSLRTYRKSATFTIEFSFFCIRIAEQMHLYLRRTGFCIRKKPETSKWGIWSQKQKRNNNEVAARMLSMWLGSKILPLVVRTVEKRRLSFVHAACRTGYVKLYVCNASHEICNQPKTCGHGHKSGIFLPFRIHPLGANGKWMNLKLQSKSCFSYTKKGNEDKEE